MQTFLPPGTNLLRIIEQFYTISEIVMIRVLQTLSLYQVWKAVHTKMREPEGEETNFLVDLQFWWKDVIG